MNEFFFYKIFLIIALQRIKLYLLYKLYIDIFLHQ